MLNRTVFRIISLLLKHLPKRRLLNELGLSAQAENWGTGGGGRIEKYVLNFNSISPYTSES